MKYNYEAVRVPIIHFSNEPDSQGHVIPPECYVAELDRNVPIPVCFNHDWDELVGFVWLYREDNVLYGDFKLKSVMKPESLALDLMRKLTPGAGFEVRDGYSNLLLIIKVTHVALTPAGNIDKTIPPLGNRVRCLNKAVLN
jgi:hypothetical protein